MIPIETERRALRLLAGRRLSERKIAAAVGISRGTVGMLKRIGHERPRPQREPTMLEAKRHGPVEQCPGCGRQIQMPCLACQAEPIAGAGRQEIPIAPPVDDFSPKLDDDLSPKLNDEERERMESLRARKIAGGESRPGDNNEQLAPIEERRMPLPEEVVQSAAEEE